MQELGSCARECLRGTGIDEQDLLARTRSRFTLEQEFRFHRNLLQLSGDPLLGLRLGKAYTLQIYGLLATPFSAPRHCARL